MDLLASHSSSRLTISERSMQLMGVPARAQASHRNQPPGSSAQPAPFQARTLLHAARQRHQPVVHVAQPAAAARDVVQGGLSGEGRGWLGGGGGLGRGGSGPGRWR